MEKKYIGDVPNQRQKK